MFIMFSPSRRTLKPAPHENPSRQTLKLYPHETSPSATLNTPLASNSRPEGTFTVRKGNVDISNGASEAFHNRGSQADTYEGDFTAEDADDAFTPEQLGISNIWE